MSELEHTKAGDMVIVNRHPYPSRVDTVIRTTANHIIVGRSSYRRINGRLVGGSTWASSWISFGTPEELDKVATEQKRAALAEKLRTFEYFKHPLEVLENIAACLPAKESK